MRIFKSFVMAAIVAMTVALSGCSHKEFKDPNANYINDLLGFVPAKSEIVITVNPSKVLASTGASWTDSGIKCGTFIEGFAEDMTSDKKILEKLKDGVQFNGINRASAVFFCDGIRSWYGIFAITNTENLKDFLYEHDFDESEYDGFNVWDKDDDDFGAFVIDSDDGLLWLTIGNTGSDAAEAIKSIKKSAKDEALPDWTYTYLNKENSEVAAITNLNAFGVNLPGLLKTLGINPALLGNDIAYISASFCENNHKAIMTVNTLDKTGKSTNLINPQLRQGADFSALNALPTECGSGLGFALNAQTLFNWVPAMANAFDNAEYKSVLEAIRSVAVGITPIDINAIKESAQFPGLAVIVKADEANIRKFYDLVLANNESSPYPITIGQNELSMTIRELGLPHEIALRFIIKGDMAMITTIPEADFGKDDKLSVNTSDALMAAYQLPNAFITADPMPEGYCVLTPDKLISEVNIDSKYPGVFGAILYLATYNNFEPYMSGLDL